MCRHGVLILITDNQYVIRRPHSFAIRLVKVGNGTKLVIECTGGVHGAGPWGTDPREPKHQHATTALHFRAQHTRRGKVVADGWLSPISPRVANGLPDLSYKKRYRRLPVCSTRLGRKRFPVWILEVVPCVTRRVPVQGGAPLYVCSDMRQASV